MTEGRRNDRRGAPGMTDSTDRLLREFRNGALRRGRIFPNRPTMQGARRGVGTESVLCSGRQTDPPVRYADSPPA